VSVASHVVAVAAGNSHSLFLKNDGTLWAMGYNGDGELGDGITTDRRSPVAVAGGNHVVAVAAGYEHSLFVKDDGTLWAMGTNTRGELGDGTTTGSHSPVSLTGMSLASIISGCEASHTLAVGMPLVAVISPPLGFHQIAGQLLSAGNMRLSFVGVPGWNYALDRSFSLSPADWVPQATNAADAFGAFGALVFTNTPSPGTNNFWRMRFVP
jgi:alpha-tubulin suppressor-like RCC1 family protein